MLPQYIRKNLLSFFHNKCYQEYEEQEITLLVHETCLVLFATLQIHLSIWVLPSLIAYFPTSIFVEKKIIEGILSLVY